MEWAVEEKVSVGRACRVIGIHRSIAAGLYYELAQTHWKMQQKYETCRNAEKALEIAKLAKDDLDKYQALATQVRL
ncbi:hypothetical protein [Dyadobacter sp. SG02]|uniref:hypothetical protein n=1 Tax=Dyadobacter sp. SG02 TaxID=1855291 RepID=UPI000B8498A9|nr:hypothetical protein [Dyadobacter sp. SG02]